jgi:predicted metalloendopeptidase
VIPAYEEHIKKMFVLAGVDLKNAVKYATMVVEIESTLAAIALPSDDTRNPVETYHNYTLAGLQKLAPHVFVGDKDADSVLLSALSPDTKLTRFVVSEPSVLKAVNKLVEGISPVTWVVYL